MTSEAAPATPTTATVYGFRTENEGIVEITLYATEESAIAAVLAHIEEWYGHREKMIGGQLVWAAEYPDRVPGLTDDAANLLPIRKALNARDHYKAIELYNEWNPDDYTCGVETMDVRP